MVSPITRRILDDPPLPVLLRLASPSALAFLVQASVSLAELGFIGRLGTVPLAGLALIFPGLMLMQMLANGSMGGAVSSAIARALGADRRADAEALIWHALAIAVTGGSLFTLTYVAFGEALIGGFGVDEPVARAAADYAGIVFGGAVVVWMSALLNAVLRGMGRMLVPALLMVGGAFIQVPLAGTLVLGWFGAPTLGIRGAAVALLVMAGVMLLVQLWVLASGRVDLGLRRAACVLRATLFREILRVGALASVSPVFSVLTIMATTALIGRFGVAALAGYGIVSRVEFLLIPMIFGLGAAMTFMVGVNVGAGHFTRAEHIGWLGGFTAAAITGVVGVVLAIAPQLVLAWFTNDPATVASGTSYLHIVGPVFAFQGLGGSLYFASQGAGNVAWPVIATVLRFVVAIGGAVLGLALFEASVAYVYGCLAAGMFVYGALTAGSIRFGAWRR